MPDENTTQKNVPFYPIEEQVPARSLRHRLLGMLVRTLFALPLLLFALAAAVIAWPVWVCSSHEQ